MSRQMHLNACFFALALVAASAPAAAKPLYITVNRSFGTDEHPVVDVAFQNRGPVELRVLKPKDLESYLKAQANLRRVWDEPNTTHNPGRALSRGLNASRGPGQFLLFALDPELRARLSPALGAREESDGTATLRVAEGPKKLVGVPDGLEQVRAQWLNLDLGGGPLEDIVACKRWLVKEANVDEQRVVVLGGSYGGYMALAAATFKPKEFAANVDYFGVSDLKSLVESFPPYWATFATYIYQKFGDPKNPEHAKYQHDRSPLNFLDQVERPLLVVQGENDARVKKDQSDRAVEKLRARKVPVHYLVIPGEGHGFSKNENRLAAFQATDRFLDRYLFGDTSVEVIAGER